MKKIAFILGFLFFCSQTVLADEIVAEQDIRPVERRLRFLFRQVLIMDRAYGFAKRENLG